MRVPWLDLLGRRWSVDHTRDHRPWYLKPQPVDSAKRGSRQFQSKNLGYFLRLFEEQVIIGVKFWIKTPGPLVTNNLGIQIESA